MAQPSLYHVPLSHPFIPTLAKGLLERYGHLAEGLGKIVVLLPTRRGCLALKRALIDQTTPRCLILPKIIALADLEQFPLLPKFLTTTELPTVLSTLQQTGLLTQLVLAFEKQKYDRENLAVATSLAAELGALLEEAATSAVELSQIHNLVSDDYAEHWQLTLDFLKIITDVWPCILKDHQKIDAATRNRLQLEQIAKDWAPDYPVILAGTTGTRPATAALAKSILSFPHGCVVLPGVDPLLWSSSSPDFSLETFLESLPVTHPQSPLVHFCTILGAPLFHSQPWVKNTPTSPRHLLLSLAMRPHLEEANRDNLSESGENLTMTTCATAQDEAQTIALMIRYELETPDQTIAVITPDQQLTKRLISELKRWNITPNSSSGIPLAQSVVGLFLSQTALIHRNMLAVDFLSVLKHPLCQKYQERGTHLKNTRTFEQHCIRKLDTPFTMHIVPQDEDIHAWHTHLLSLINPFLKLSDEDGKRPLKEWLQAHKHLCETLSGQNEQGNEQGQDAEEKTPWHGEDGKTALAFFDSLLSEAHHFPSCSFWDYSPLLQTFMNSYSVHDTQGIGSRIYILGTLEARLHYADVTILAGLTEGTWPPKLKEDPWLNRTMRLHLGLPDPQRRIGLSAHDFCLGFSARKVYLTRSLRADGAPTIASRWWQRLEAIIAGHGITLRTPPWEDWVKQLDQPAAFTPLSAPSPCPPASVRPTTYSVTDIGVLMQDPYALYAKHILRLRPLSPLDQSLSHKERGQLIHEAIDLFYKNYKKNTHIDPLDYLLHCGEKVFLPHYHHALVRTFWWSRFVKIATWIIAQYHQETDSIINTISEHRGQLPLVIAPDLTFTIKTIADRIDLLKDETIRLIDYKTGAIPTLKSVYQGLSPQLPLEGIIFQALNPFEPCLAGKTAQVSQLSYWSLQGTGAQTGKIIDLKNPQDLIEDATVGVVNLLKTFSLPTTPYLACPSSSPSPFNDYAHLERLDEWKRSLSETI